MTLPSSNLPRFRPDLARQGATKRSRPQLWLATTLSAALLAACGGGGGGEADPTMTAGTTGEGSQFESVISSQPQVREMVLAHTLSTKSESDDESDNDRRQDEGTDDSDDEASEDQSDNASDRSADRSGLLDLLVSDMREMNDHPLKNVNPKYGFARGPGYVQGGVNPRGSNYVLPWFVTFEGEGNSARNTRIQMRNLRMFLRMDNGEWKRLIDVDSYAGIECEQHGNYFECPQVAKVRKEEGSASSLPVPDRNLHGWWDSRVRIDSYDISAIVVSLEARLIVDDENRGDDRHKAKYLVTVGADYYPTDERPSGALLPVGMSRSKLVTNEWQTFALTTLNDVGRQEPGGGISEAELRRNPPPL